MIIIEKVLDILYPKVCSFCGKIQKNSLCPKCKRELNNSKNVTIQNYSDWYFSRHCSLFSYEGRIKDMLLRYKFGNQPYLQEGLGNFILQDKKSCGFLKNYDIIIPVPISKKRKKQRGYNQSELLVRTLAKEMVNLQPMIGILQKQKDTVAQSLLTKQQRKTNLIGAYFVKHKEKITGKKILLLDDIFTTGSTVSECSKVLLEAGAQTIDVLTIAKD